MDEVNFITVFRVRKRRSGVRGDVIPNYYFVKSVVQEFRISDFWIRGLASAGEVFRRRVEVAQVVAVPVRLVFLLLYRLLWVVLDRLKPSQKSRTVVEIFEENEQELLGLRGLELNDP